MNAAGGQGVALHLLHYVFTICVEKCVAYIKYKGVLISP